MIDYDSPLAPYRQVAAILRERIDAGEITNRLPSIASLTQEFGIARVTAAKALKLLVDDGIAEVSPGMGTFLVRRSELGGQVTHGVGQVAGGVPGVRGGTAKHGSRPG